MTTTSRAVCLNRISMKYQIMAVLDQSIEAFLYARSFPKDEWSKRVHEAFAGMQLP